MSALLCLAACTEVPNAPNAPHAVQAVPLLAKISGPYGGVFADAAGDKLLSDGRGTYINGIDCVDSQVHAGGLYQVRSIANAGVCKAQTRGTWRYFTIDLGAAVVDLDQDGVAEAIEAAPGRLLAANAYAQGATSTSVTIFIFDVLANGSTTPYAKWTLLYKNNVPLSGSGTTRVIQAVPGSAAVDIYAGDVDPRRPNQNLLVATVDLPFKLTVTPQ